MSIFSTQQNLFRNQLIPGHWYGLFILLVDFIFVFKSSIEFGRVVWMRFLVFHCSLWRSYGFFLDWSMEACDFCGIGSGFFWQTSLFSPIFMVFGWRIGDLCDLYVVGNFVFFGGFICILAVNFMYILSLVISLDSFFFVCYEFFLVYLVLLYDEFRPSAVFQLLRRFWTIVGLDYSQHHSNCLVGFCFWIGSPKVPQRRKFFFFHAGPYYLPSFKKVRFRLYFTSSISLSFFFCISHKIIRERDCFLDCLSI